MGWGEPLSPTVSTGHPAESGLRGRLERDFTYHAPKNDQPARYEQIRAAGKAFALLLAHLCPDSRERSVAFTNVDQAVMWANAAIARNE